MSEHAHTRRRDRARRGGAARGRHHRRRPERPRGVYPDRSGPVIVDRLRVVGLPGRTSRSSCRTATSSAWPCATRWRREPDLVVSTGGTGLTPTDVTPEQTLPLLDRLVPGVAEGMRAAGVAKGVPTAMLSRGLVGIAGRSLVVNLPGSRGGVSDGLDVLEPVLGHVLAQIPGGDH